MTYEDDAAEAISKLPPEAAVRVLIRLLVRTGNAPGVQFYGLLSDEHRAEFDRRMAAFEAYQRAHP